MAISDDTAEPSEPDSASLSGVRPTHSEGVFSADEIQLADILASAKRNARLVVALPSICMAIALLFVLVSPSVYRAEVLAYPVRTDKDPASALGGIASQFGGLAKMVGVNIDNGGTQTETALAVFSSRRFLSEYVSDRDLMPVLFADYWDGDRREWKSPTIIKRVTSFLARFLVGRPADVAKRGTPTEWDGYRKMTGKVVSSSVDKESGLVTFAVEWVEPKFAADLANDIVSRLNEDIKRRDVEEAEKSVRFLREQLASNPPVEIQMSFYALIEEQMKTIMLANVREGYAFSIVDPAIAPERSIRPDAVLIMLFGFVFGSVLSLLLVFFRIEKPAVAGG